jgi:hypothetical protein
MSETRRDARAATGLTDDQRGELLKRRMANLHLKQQDQIDALSNQLSHAVKVYNDLQADAVYTEMVNLSLEQEVLELSRRLQHALDENRVFKGEMTRLNQLLRDHGIDPEQERENSTSSTNSSVTPSSSPPSRGNAFSSSSSLSDTQQQGWEALPPQLPTAQAAILHPNNRGVTHPMAAPANQVAVLGQAVNPHNHFKVRPRKKNPLTQQTTQTASMITDDSSNLLSPLPPFTFTP